MENIDESLESNQDHCKPIVNQPISRAVRNHCATLALVRANFENIFIPSTLFIYILIFFYFSFILDHFSAHTCICMQYVCAGNNKSSSSAMSGSL